MSGTGYGKSHKPEANQQEYVISRDGGPEESISLHPMTMGATGLTERRLARGLGWFSLGLGLAELIGARPLAKLVGVSSANQGIFRALGVREIGTGIRILAGNNPAPGLWWRVGGDIMDLALLGAATMSPKANRGRIAAATAVVAGVTALDLISAQQSGRRSAATSGREILRVAQAVTINRPPEMLYEFWRDFQNLPRFMKHLESVEIIGTKATVPGDGDQSRSGANKLTHWVAKGPAGTKVEWDAEILEDRANEMIAWRSLEGADVDNIGSVRFESAPGGHETIVRVRLQYNPPAGVIGATVARLFGEDPAWQIKDDLRRFKQIMEAGEVITTEGQSAGRSQSTS